ncbi:hypothetical protein ACJ6WD_10815 [Streptomyces sp. VTCC 41912]|uniref:hypothetical protein n=1 Tax=Streptomyces sp. VTCC 41912 TaxID=3383243 RepID=UPI003896C58B
MESYWNGRPVYDKGNALRAAPLVVNYDLDELGIGENWFVSGVRDGFRMVDRGIVPGAGWCRALSAPECAWPPGADLCVVVNWYPDASFIGTFSNSPKKAKALFGKSHAEVEAHWATRLKAVAEALRSLGYIVERAGRRPRPTQDANASLLVYRMGPGAEPPVRPVDAWRWVPSPRVYRWSEKSPLEVLQRRMDDAGFRYQAGKGVVVRDIDTVLWPPLSSFCAQLDWWPDKVSSSEELYDKLDQILSAVKTGGYQVRVQERPMKIGAQHFSALVFQTVEPISPINFATIAGKAE